MAEKVVKIIKSTKSIERVLISSFSYRRLDEFLEASQGKILTSGSFRENAIAKFLKNKKRNHGYQYCTVARGALLLLLSLPNLCG